MKIAEFQKIMQDKVFQLMSNCTDNVTVQKSVEILCNEFSSKLENLKKTKITRRFNEIYKNIVNEKNIKI